MFFKLSNHTHTVQSTYIYIHKEKETFWKNIKIWSSKICRSVTNEKCWCLKNLWRIFSLNKISELISDILLEMSHLCCGDQTFSIISIFHQLWEYGNTRTESYFIVISNSCWQNNQHNRLLDLSIVSHDLPQQT